MAITAPTHFIHAIAPRFSADAIDAIIEHGIPEHIRSGNGPEFIAKELRKWLARTGSATLYIEPGSLWENVYCESFNSKLRDDFLNGEIFSVVSG